MQKGLVAFVLIQSVVQKHLILFVVNFSRYLIQLTLLLRLRSVQNPPQDPAKRAGLSAPLRSSGLEISEYMYVFVPIHSLNSTETVLLYIVRRRGNRDKAIRRETGAHKNEPSPLHCTSQLSAANQLI